MVKSKKINDIYLVNATDSDKPCWFYLHLDTGKAAFFEKTIVQSPNIDLGQWGKILISGWGENPPLKVAEKIKLEALSFNLTEEQYLPKLFFIKNQHEGREFYSFIMVPILWVEEFQYMCTIGNFDFNDYGAVVQSAWGKPSEQVLQYMEREYDFVRCNISHLLKDDVTEPA